MIISLIKYQIILPHDDMFDDQLRFVAVVLSLSRKNDEIKMNELVFSIFQQYELHNHLLNVSIHVHFLIVALYTSQSLHHILHEDD
jgi:hypothetical protein